MFFFYFSFWISSYRTDQSGPVGENTCSRTPVSELRKSLLPAPGTGCFQIDHAHRNGQHPLAPQQLVQPQVEFASERCGCKRSYYGRNGWVQSRWRRIRRRLHHPRHRAQRSIPASSQRENGRQCHRRNRLLHGRLPKRGPARSVSWAIGWRNAIGDSRRVHRRARHPLRNNRRNRLLLATWRWIRLFAINLCGTQCDSVSLGFERKVLNAAAHVQTEVKCPVSIHPGMNKESPCEVLRVFQEAGGDGRKVAVCHLDSKLFSGEMLHYFVHFSLDRDHLQRRGFDGIRSNGVLPGIRFVRWRQRLLQTSDWNSRRHANGRFSAHWQHFTTHRTGLRGQNNRSSRHSLQKSAGMFTLP